MLVFSLSLLSSALLHYYLNLLGHYVCARVYVFDMCVGEFVLDYIWASFPVSVRKG